MAHRSSPGVRRISRLFLLLTLAACVPSTPARRTTPPPDDQGDTGGAGEPGTGGAPAGTGGARGTPTGGRGGDTGGAGGRDASSPPEIVDASFPDAQLPADTANPITDAAPSGGGEAGSGSPANNPFPPGPAPIGSGWMEVFPMHTVDFPPNGQARYTENNGKFHMWLLNTDPSTFPGRDAGPRSEVNWHNAYTSGQAQFQGDFYIDHDCAHASVMQIFGATGRSTTAMFWAMPDSLRYYGQNLVYSPAWDHFFRLNVTHDTATGQIDVHVDGQKKATFTDHGAATHYFKSGIYQQPNMTPRCDVYMENIHIFKK
jgi:hypothetical protein